MEEFTTALAKAQQERFRHEALFRQMEEGNVEGMPLVLENKVIQEFKAQKAKLEAQYQTRRGESEDRVVGVASWSFGL